MSSWTWIIAPSAGLRTSTRDSPQPARTPPPRMMLAEHSPAAREKGSSSTDVIVGAGPRTTRGTIDRVRLVSGLIAEREDRQFYGTLRAFWTSGVVGVVDRHLTIFGPSHGCHRSRRHGLRDYSDGDMSPLERRAHVLG